MNTLKTLFNKILEFSIPEDPVWSTEQELVTKIIFHTNNKEYGEHVIIDLNDFQDDSECKQCNPCDHTFRYTIKEIEAIVSTLQEILAQARLEKHPSDNEEIYPIRK